MGIILSENFILFFSKYSHAPAPKSDSQFLMRIDDNSGVFVNNESADFLCQNRGS